MLTIYSTLTVEITAARKLISGKIGSLFFLGFAVTLLSSCSQPMGESSYVVPGFLGTDNSNATPTPTPVTATSLAFSIQPSNTGDTDTVLASQPEIEIQGAGAALASSATNAVTLKAYSDVTCTTEVIGGVTATTNPVTAVGGVAAFTGVKALKTNVIRIGASAVGLTDACSNALVVSPGAPASIAVSSGDTQTGNISTALASSLVAVVRDANSNTLAANTTINWAVTGGGGSLGAATSLTNGSGLASNTLTLGPTGGASNNTVTASPNGYPAVTVTFTASATAPSLAWTPLTHSFGTNILVGTNSATQDFTLTNSGNGSATSCGSASISDTSNFTITSNGCTAATLAAAGTCVVTVRANPTAAAAASATISRTCTVGGTPTTTANQITATGIDCPANYVRVPGNSTLGVSSFCVMQYEAKNSAGNALSLAAGNAWTSITQTSAKTECTDLNTLNGVVNKYDLISNAEWLTLAQNLENVAANWSGAVVGTGHLNRGWSASVADDGFANTAPSTGASAACVYNTGVNTCAAGGVHKLKRTHSTSLSEETWDLSGNVWEWVDWSMAAGLQSGPTACTGVWIEIPTIACGSLSLSEYMPANPAAVTAANYNSTYGLGQFYGGAGTGGAAIRGNNWSSGVLDGIFALNFNNAAAFSSPHVGYRCVFRP